MVEPKKIVYLYLHNILIYFSTFNSLFNVSSRRRKGPRHSVSSLRLLVSEDCKGEDLDCGFSEAGVWLVGSSLGGWSPCSSVGCSRVFPPSRC